MPDTFGDFTKRVGVGGNVYNYIQAPQTVVFEGKHALINGAPVNRFWITSFKNGAPTTLFF